MQIHPKLLETCLELGLNKEDIEELASRLIGNANQYKAARELAERQLEQNAAVVTGLNETIASAAAQENRALEFLQKITVAE